MKHASHAAALAFAALATGSVNVQAQSMDYGSLQALFGGPVTTSAIGIPQRASDAPVTMEIITADEIRRSPATDLAGVLKNRAGVEVSQWTLGAADVAVRGYNQAGNPRLLVLVNGRQVFLDHFGLVSWNTIPVQLDEIRQIEIVKGPNTALFGFNAVSGVVNIVTFNPLYDDVDKVSVRVGTQDHQEGSFVGSFKLGDKAGFRISAGGTDADPFNTPTPLNEQSQLIDYKRRALSLDSLFQIGSKTQLGLEGTTSSSDQTDLLPILNLSGMDYETQSLRGRLLSDTSFGNIEADLYTNILDLTAAFGNLNFNNQVTVFKLQNVFRIGTSHNMRVMGEYRHNWMENSNGNGGEISFDVFSLGGMWNWLINDKFSLTNALRLDNLKMNREGPKLAQIPFSNSEYDADLLTLSVNSGLVFKPDQVNTIRVSYGRGVEAPSLIDAGFQIISGPVALGGNPYMDPTIVNNYELAWERPVAAINGNFRSAIFYQKSTDIKGITVRPVISPFGVAIVADNIGSSELVGGEIQFEGKVGKKWDWRFNYTLEEIDDKLANRVGGVYTLTREFEKSTPKHTVNGQVGYTIDKWEFDLLGKYVSSSDRIRTRTTAPVNFLQPVDDYITASARIGYKLTDEFSLAIQGQDIQQEELRQTQAPKTERRVFLTLSSEF